MHASSNIQVFEAELFRSQAGSKKVCWLGHMTRAAFRTNEARDYAGEASPKIIKALALTNSVMSRSARLAWQYL